MGQAEISAVAALLGRAMLEQTNSERIEHYLEHGGALRLEADPDNEGLAVVTIDGQEVARLERATIEAVAGHVGP